MARRLRLLTEGRKRFLGDVAHELRSPIARMQLATEILERESKGGASKYVEDIKDDIVLMSRLTDELLQFAKAETAPGPISLAAVSVAEAVQAALRQESPPDGVDIRNDVDPEIRVQANMEYLVRSLANVLRNAIRYAGEKGPIRISTERRNNQVQISVRDSGPGVPEDALEKIFTPFYRLDDARDRRTGGTGLGLAIVRTCIEACGGVVECRNRQPSGLEIIISLSEAP
jgi:two-component system sensor histidine kinase CpxA